MRLTSWLFFSAGLFLAGPVVAADKPLVVELWPGKVPDETGNIGPEKVRMSPKLDRKQVEVTEPTRLVTNVSKPTLTIYRPAKDKDTGAAILICPGGGYWNLYWELEGEEVAAWLEFAGRDRHHPQVPGAAPPDEPKGEPARRPLQDAQRAVSLVRSKAKEWGIDPKRIGMVGFSAGGHLAHRHGDELREADLRADRRHRQGQLPAGLRHRGLLGLPEGQGQGRARPRPAHPGRGRRRSSSAHGGADIISAPEHSVVTVPGPEARRRPGGAAHLRGGRPRLRRPASDHPCSTWTRACADWLRHQGFLKPSTQP